MGGALHPFVFVLPEKKWKQLLPIPHDLYDDCVRNDFDLLHATARHAKEVNQSKLIYIYPLRHLLKNNIYCSLFDVNDYYVDIINTVDILFEFK